MSRSDEDLPGLGPEEFNPSLWDVLKVRYLLQWKLTVGLPEELVDMIIDAAEYWPSIEQKLQGHRIIQKDCDQVLLKTVPLCYDRNVCRPGCLDEPVLIIFSLRVWNENQILPSCLTVVPTLAAK